MSKSIFIKKISNYGKEISQRLDFLAIEEPLEISVKYGKNQEVLPISVTMRTPGNDQELAIGFLFTEAIISKRSHLNFPVSKVLQNNKIVIHLHPEFSTDLQKLKRNFYTTSSCGVCGKESIEAIKQACQITTAKPEKKVKFQTLFILENQLREAQKTFEETGGIHASALFTLDGQLIDIREDVGRHNALDKLIGARFLQSNSPNFSLENEILLLSGRASFELIQKSAMAGIQVVCSIGAPSSLAVETAIDFGITLIGFLKNGTCNVYCGQEKLA